VPQIDVRAGQTVVLEPGGFHIMLLQLVAPLQASQAVPVTVTFADGSSQTVTATVRDG
jgi:periplasmic copper chaperone A